MDGDGLIGGDGESPRAAAATTADLVTAALSPREVEVVLLVAGGATNDEIAARLFISPRTVQSHVDNSMRKTSVRNRTELAVLAVREGLVPERGQALQGSEPVGLAAAE